jgi:hypothetical protein
MFADAPRVIGRFKILWPGIVQHEKRTDLSIEVVARE